MTLFTLTFSFQKANWGEWNLPYILCDFYLAMDVVCSTSSIFNLVAISFDRFFAVTSPILYSQHRHNFTPAYMVILVCWSTSLAIGLPIMFGLNHRPYSTNQKIYTSQVLLSQRLRHEIRQIFSIMTPQFY